MALVAVLVTQSWHPLAEVDEQGRPAEGWATRHHVVPGLLRAIEVAFGTVGMTVLTVLVVVLLVWRSHRRAAVFVAAVMIVTSTVTGVLKAAYGRARPLWQDPVGLLTTHSFPSGHSSAIAAFTGSLAVLVVVFVRRRSTRRLLLVGLAVLALVVCADRVLLGRHYPSDVLAGALLGGGVVLLGLVVYSPHPRTSAPPTAAELSATVGSRSRELHVVLNPSKVESQGQFEAIVTTMAGESGWSGPTWHYTTVDDSGTGMAAAASVAGADLVVVCGGDGTVREVCAELAGTGIPVGIVPAGTGNLLARNLGIPLYLRAAIDVALTGQDRAIDLVAVSGDGLEDSHFLVMAGMGFDAAVMEGVNEGIKRRVGWPAYVLSGMKSLMFPAVRVEISLDGAAPTRHRARTIVVGNVGFLQAGMPLLPDASIDDGLLDVVLLHPRRFVSWIRIAYRVLARSPATDETLDRMTGRTVSIQASSDTPRQLDGDSVGSGRELTMECQPGRLLVRVPR